MTDFLVRRFIKNHDNISDNNVRRRYGILGGVVGIILNMLLFIGKFLAGIFTSSISITADAVNNLSDAGSSIITLVGFKMSGKPADSEHPFGHGRYEYISGFVISMAIIMMAFEIGKTSLKKIINPEVSEFQWLSVIILSVAILIKLWLGVFNNRLGDKINSKTMKATARDSLGDVMATSAVLLGVIINRVFAVNVDAYLGILVALFIMYAGISAARDTLNQLLGEAPDKQFVEDIKNTAISYKEIIGVHDLIVHNYGAGRSIISLHAEVSCECDMMKIHDVIDNIEKEMKQKFNCETVIHMDPIAVNDENIKNAYTKVSALLLEIDKQISMHDFRMVEGETHTNLIFDVVVPFEFKLSDCELIDLITKKVKEVDAKYNLVMQIDKEAF